MTDSAVRQSKGSPMTTRTTSKTVVFTRPFILAGFVGTQAAGAYVVETEEELRPGDLFPVWQRRSNVIELYPRPGEKLSAKVGSTELDAALMEDGAWAALRFESRTRREHRIATRTFFDTIKAERKAGLGAAFRITGR